MRLIDADTLPRHEQLEPMGNGKYENIEVVYGDDIDNAPTIDAVPVVRCKNCKHRYITGSTTHYYVCDFMDAEYNDNGYCHHGERKDDDN